MSDTQRRPVDRDRLREIVERAGKASDLDPELHDRGGDPMGYDVRGTNDTDIRGVRGMFLREEDASFVAHAKQDVADLAQALDKAWDKKEATIRVTSTLMIGWRELFREVLREHRPDEEDFCTCGEHFRPEDMPEAWIEHVISLVEEKAREDFREALE